MSFFRRLFGRNNEPPVEETHPSIADENSKLADSPVLFANWLNKYLILGPSFEEDLSLAPDEAQCKRLKISEEERQLCANEYVLLRALGACIFVKNNLDESYYLLFKNTLIPEVVKRMKINSPKGHHENLSDALEQYLEDLEKDSHVAFSMTYLSRVYPDTPNSDSLFLQGIPVNLGFKYVLTNFEVTQSAYSRLKFGMSFEELEKLNNALDESNKKSSED